jgi:hypothetical protein
MTASELILQLKHLPPDTKILIRGYEDSYNDIRELKPRRVKPNPAAEWYYGEYADSSDKDAIDAIELYGENKNEVG